MTDTTPPETRTRVLHQISLTEHRPLEFEERDWLRRTLERTFDELDRLRAVEAAAYGFADEMADYCSHGSHIVTDQARQLRECLNNAQIGAAL